MAYVFKKLDALGVGKTEVELPAFTVKAFLLNINAANLTSQELPISVYIKKFNGFVSYIAKNKRISGNMNEEIMKIGKLPLEIGDKICISAGSEEAFDVIVSVLEGIK